MNREILFRGKRIDNGEWVSRGSLIRLGDGGTVVIPSKSDVFYQEGETFLATMDCIEVDPATVGQYTGLTDKNGVKIFEGDIVRRRWCDVTAEYNVVFDDSFAAFIGERIGIEMFTSFDGDGDLFEVIGNIFDKEERNGKTDA